MVYIIQTNTSLNNYNEPMDFQSIMFQYSSWEDYKKDLLTEKAKHEIITGTLEGCIKPRESIIEEIIRNDDYHIECIISNGYMRINAKGYKVGVDEFNFLLKS